MDWALGCISMSAGGSGGAAETGLRASWAAVVNRAQVKLNKGSDLTGPAIQLLKNSS